jgi:hypothetical protein
VKRTEVYLTTRQRNILTILAKKKNVSMAHLIRLSIDLYIEQLEKESKNGNTTK